MREGGPPRQLIDLLLASREDGGLSHGELLDDVLTFIMAGHDTTSKVSAYPACACVVLPAALQLRTAGLNSMSPSRPPLSTGRCLRDAVAGEAP